MAQFYGDSDNSWTATPGADDSNDEDIAFLLQRAENRMRSALAARGAGAIGLACEAPRSSEDRKDAQFE